MLSWFDQVVDVAALAAAGLFDDAHVEALSASTLNAFMDLGRPAWRAVRSRLQELLSASNAELRDNEALRAKAMYAQSAV